MRIVYESELYHHGIKGQKWGVRRFQKKDGTLTPAGKKRYDDVEAAAKTLAARKADYAKANANYNRKTAGGLIYNKQATDKLVKASYEQNFAKQDLKNAKLLAKLEGSKKSNRQLKFEEQYLKEGMSPDEATVAAYKRVQTERALGALAAVAVTALSAHAAYRYYDNHVDRTIKAGTTLQNILTNKDRGVADAFYSSQSKWDNAKYRGMYGKTLSKNGMMDVYERKLKVTKDMRLASRNSASAIVGKLMNNDPAFKQDVIDSIKVNSMAGWMPKQKKVLDKALASLSLGKNDKNVYEAVNMLLVDHSDRGTRISTKLYDALKSSGYDAIMDINDSRYSGYNSKTARIVFNGANKINSDSIRKLGQNEINKYNNLMLGSIITKSLASQGAIAAAAYAGVSLYKSSASRKQVNEYRKEHPNTKLSNTEIERMLIRDNMS